MRTRARLIVVPALITVLLGIAPSSADAAPFFHRSLDGSSNNPLHPAWGRANTLYLRVAPVNYRDGISAMQTGPSLRYVSNRVFNDIHQNLFSENGVTQWGWVWGQFIDHDFGLRDERPAESEPIGFSPSDQLEEFTNSFGVIAFSRTPAAPGTGPGTNTPRQHVNTITSFIDASNVYGVDERRLEWLRAGPVDNDLSNNAARLLLPDGYLPKATARGDVASAPVMDLMGPLTGRPAAAVVAGDVRANENIALTALHTLFAREHNRIVSRLPAFFSAEEKFQIARRVVGAEIAHITYTEFLPALGLRLEPYRGYNPTVNPGLANEFAVVGYRAHSMIHGEFDLAVPLGTYTPEQLARIARNGVVVESTPTEITLEVPLSAAFGNPDLLQLIGIGPLLESLSKRQYRNDEQIDNALRSVLFQVPKPGIPDPSICGVPAINPDCFTVVNDLGAIDVARGRDHGMPSYNDLRRAYGLAPKASFIAITGESTAGLPVGTTIDDPAILDFLEIRDAAGNLIPFGTPEAEEEAVSGVRRSTLAARLRSVYGSVDRLDAFVGMVSEKHVPGTEFGELQLAIWKKQFEALRDGDRFFYQNDPFLRFIDLAFGIDYRQSLSQIVKRNTGVTLPADVFKFAG